MTVPCASVEMTAKLVPGPERTLRLEVVTSPLPMGVGDVGLAGALDVGAVGVDGVLGLVSDCVI